MSSSRNFTLNKTTASIKRFNLIIFFFISLIFLYVDASPYTNDKFILKDPLILANLNYEPLSGSEIKSLSFRDSSDCNYTKRRFLRAASEWSLTQIFPWAYNRYIREAEFAKVTWESIKYNFDFNHWEWDDNTFRTNQFAHPYQGNLYFNSFRSNGYNFWQSAPAALAGSYVWEVAAETHPPAPNDWINTTLGGISLGEMTFRVSNLIVDNTQRGFIRQVNEVFGLIVNPLNGLNRIIDNKWGRVCANSADFKPTVLKGNFDIGYRKFSQNVNDVIDKGQNELFLKVSFVYGNPFSDFYKPFNSFDLIFEAGASDSAFINRVYVNGILHGWELKEAEKVEHVFIATMNYDYIKNSFFEYGAQSFRGSFISRYTFSEKYKLTTEAGVIGVAIAAVPDDYLSYGEGRNYDFGPGTGVAAGADLSLNNNFQLSFKYMGAWFWTVNGNESKHDIHSLMLEPRYYITQNFSSGITIGYLSLNSHYVDFPNVIHKYYNFRIFFSFRIGRGT